MNNIKWSQKKHLKIRFEIEFRYYKFSFCTLVYLIINYNCCSYIVILSYFIIKDIE